jgi:hypothetical protein
MEECGKTLERCPCRRVRTEAMCFFLRRSSGGTGTSLYKSEGTDPEKLCNIEHSAKKRFAI